MNRLHGALVLLSLMTCSQAAWAGPFPEMTTFGTAWDSYVPNGHPYDTPNTITGSPPPLGTYSGGSYGTQQEGWFDSRNGRNGIMARYANGTNGISSPTGAGYGAIWPKLGQSFGLGDGPFGHPSKQADETVNAGINLGGNNAGTLAKWSFQTTVYLDPLLPLDDPGISSGWQWTNAIADSTNGYYATEAGFNVNHVSANSFKFTTDSGSTVINSLAPSQWVTMEVRYNFTGTQLGAVENVWNQPHTQLLGSFTIAAGGLPDNPTSAGSQGGPRSSYFTNFGQHWVSSSAHLVLDSVGVGVPISLHGLLADMNNDGVVNTLDIQPFETALTNPSGYLAGSSSFANGPITDAERIYRGDITGNGAFNTLDIQPFEIYLTTPHGPTAGPTVAAVPEPPAFVLFALGAVVVLIARGKSCLGKLARA